MGVTVLFCRHGETTANRDDKATKEDVPMTETGVEQANQLARRIQLRDVSTVYTSTLQRARQTGAIVAAPHDLSPEPMAVFREISVGEFSGQPAAAWHTALRDADDIYEWTPPGGESFEQAEERLLTAFTELRRRYTDDDTVVVVGHGGIIRIFVLSLLGANYKSFFNLNQANCCLNEIEYRPPTEEWVVKSLNNTSHLE